MTDTLRFLDETEICERSLRRLAASRLCTLIKNGEDYQINGAGMLGLTFTDDECWEVLQTLPLLADASYPIKPGVPQE